MNRRFAYDASGERILLREVNLSPVVYTLTLRDLGGKVLREVTSTPSTGSWAWGKDYIWREGYLLASVSASEGLRHYHLDHLGSPRLLTDRCGERLASWQLWPFGLDPQGQAGGGGQHGERMRFTGHQRDLGQLDRTWDDFDYMHARTCTPYLGRLTSVDPGRDNDLRAPQSWNLYAYVRGNPLTHVDPDGAELRAALLLTGHPNALSKPLRTPLQELAVIHSAIRVFDHEVSPPVDVVYSFYGNAPGRLTLATYLARYAETSKDVTASLDLRLAPQDVARLQSFLDSQVDDHGDFFAEYHPLTNNCAQVAERAVLEAVSLDRGQQMGALVARLLAPVTITSSQLVFRLWMMDLIAGGQQWLHLVPGADGETKEETP